MTSIINLWAGPGVGKSRTAAGLFNLMKRRQYKVELVTEVAKFYTYEGNVTALKDQFLLIAQQEYWQRIVADNGVDWIITDSPPMQGLAYESFKPNLPVLHKVAQHFRDRYLNYDVMLERDASRPYDEYGRNQTLAEAKVKDAQVHLLWEAACSHRTCMDYMEMKAEADAPEVIYERMVRHTG